MHHRVRFLLLQARNEDDPMRHHEVRCFARALGIESERIHVFDLLSSTLPASALAATDIFLLGGSGHYSATDDAPWLARTLDSLRQIHASHKPMFASCWGFQVLARALGGRVVKDLARAEVGTHELFLTEAGKRDPVFGPLGENFLGQMGHEDHVVELPPGAILLASSHRVVNQAYCLRDAPVYCTQFHPELNCHDLLERVKVYPEYVERIAGIPPQEFAKLLRETPETEALLPRFVAHVLGV